MELNRLFKPVQRPERATELEMHAWVLGRKLDGLPKSGNRLFEMAQIVRRFPWPRS